ncbi:hypothetical protein EV182_004983 [Spiromyces aspiralis]|uniref:Uncharacterized protein n=1 Tax=Spiromyces aspiralis TaxID=68401 RepID=A0ACC1HQG8_9FUNG|nr:hypothetical protein EV182_004983 [Spiromyces aspiralis]
MLKRVTSRDFRRYMFKDCRWPEQHIAIYNAIFSLPMLAVEQDDIDALHSIFTAATSFNAESKKFAVLLQLVTNKYAAKFTQGQLQSMHAQASCITTFLKKSILVALEKAMTKASA